MSDILTDPTSYLEHMRSDFDRGDYRMAAMRAMALHASLVASGALPAQWRGEGTAVGALLADAEDNAGLLVNSGRPGYATLTRRCIAAVTGEGSPTAKREPSGEVLALCGPDLAGRPLDVLLDTVADLLHQGGGGPLVDCLRAKAEQARVAGAKSEG